MGKNDLSVEKLTGIFVKIRDRRAELAAAFKEEDEKLKAQQERIKDVLLDHCKEHEVDSVRTAKGVFYRTVKTRYWTSDWEQMRKFAVENDALDFFEKRLNQTAVRQFLEENPEHVPPGLNIDSKYEITVRKK